MRLVNISTMKLEEFFDDRVPPYAILSHTWGEDEVDIQAFQKNTKRNGAGWAKITNCCKRARRHDLEYIWIDTCCIDKTSSAELQEAINSMFRYYGEAAACYAFLADVRDVKSIDQFCESRWFRRGWTLQELLAPKEVIFFANSKMSTRGDRHRNGPESGWSKVGRRGKNLSSQARNLDEDILAPCISKITKIDVEFLTGLRPLSDASVATRMAWAAGRQTTRKEDRAYSMLGIFDIRMPMLYGEGDRAFERLQREIMGISNDETILAWHYGFPFGQCVHNGLFAESPDCYKACAELVPIPSSIVSRKHYTITNKGLRMKGSVEQGARAGTLLIGLNCTTRSELSRITSCTSRDDSDSEADECLRALALCLTANPGIDLLDTWRHSTSRPFEADPGAFLTHQINLLTLDDGPDRRSDSGSRGSSSRRQRRYNQRSRSFYINLTQPALNTLPFVMIIESKMLQTLEQDSRYKLIDVEPAFAVQVVDRIDEEDWDKWMVDLAHIKDIDIDVYLHYQHTGSSRRFMTQMSISIKRSAILPEETDYLHRTSDICETVLGPPDVVTTTYRCDEKVTSQQILSAKTDDCMKEATSGVWFQLKILTYKRTVACSIGHTNTQPKGDGKRANKDSDCICM